MRRVPLPTGAALLVALIGCASAPRPAGSRSAVSVVPAGTALVPVSRERETFDVDLVTASDAKPPIVRGTASIATRPDNVLLYAISIDNVSEDSFTQAQLVHVLSDSSTDVVATLFSDAMVRGRRISVRGTATLVRTLPPDELLAHVREHPGTYRIRVQAERSSGALVGYLGLAR
ncbi:MAG: hypothetical protein U0163_19745 [Gemmatimonadaceae bacterium]